MEGANPHKRMRKIQKKHCVNGFLTIDMSRLSGTHKFWLTDIRTSGIKKI